MMVNGRRTLSINAAAKFAGVSRRTIYNWLQGGKVEAIRNAGGAIRIYEDTLVKEFKKEQLKAKFIV